MIIPTIWPSDIFGTSGVFVHHAAGSEHGVQLLPDNSIMKGSLSSHFEVHFATLLQFNDLSMHLAVAFIRQLGLLKPS